MSDSTSSFSQSLFSRKLDQMDDLPNSGTGFDDARDDGIAQPDHNMEWRRQLLEESHTRIKQARSRTLDPKKLYEPGTLLFDEKDNKFGRVLHSQENFLLVEFISGGTRDYGKAPKDFDREQVPSLKLKAQKSVAKRSTRKKDTAKQAAAPKKSTTAGSKTGAKSKKSGKNAKDPGIDDVNAYIKDNFETMSNREMARHVGLSEHTIRRKLGEWGLKRNKR